VDSQLIQAERDRVVRDTLPGLTTGIAILQTVLAVVHGTLGSASERPLVLVDAASAALAAGLRFALGKGALPDRWAHPFAASSGALAVLVVLVHLRVLGDPLQSLMLALILIGAGAILLSFRWLALLAGPSLLGWLAVMGSLGFPPGTRRLGIALLDAWAGGAMILAARLRSFRRLEELRTQNEDRLTRDVTEARGLAESMRQSEETHRLLFEKSPLPMWVVERETLQFLAVNDAAVRNYGYSRAEFIEMTLRDVHPPEGIPRLLIDLASDPLDQGLPLTTRHRKKDGTLIDVEVIAHHIAFGEWNALLAVLTDVTERRRSEVALRRSRESFQQLFEEAPIGMAILASGVAFTKVNRALCTMLGYSEEELSGLSFDRFVEPTDLEAHLAAVQEFFEGKRSSFKVEERQDPARAAPVALIVADLLAGGAGRGLRAGPLRGRVLPRHLPRLHEEALREMRDVNMITP